MGLLSNKKKKKKLNGLNLILKDILEDEECHGPWFINCTTQKYLVNVGQISHFNTMIQIKFESIILWAPRLKLLFGNCFCLLFSNLSHFFCVLCFSNLEGYWSPLGVLPIITNSSLFRVTYSK